MNNDIKNYNMAAIENSLTILNSLYKIFLGLKSADLSETKLPIENYIGESGFTKSQVFGILRVAVTGSNVSPPLLESIEIIGKEKILGRLEDAILTLAESFVIASYNKIRNK
jgi:glutamyl-tRNA synthetase